jgi:Flp pilus assembly protein TadB
MTILKDVLGELLSMFLGDARLSISILVVVAAAAALIDLAGLDPLVGGAVLLLGCLATVIVAVVMTARRERLER